ncbi:hypothetical protein LH464_23880 [Neorhizobium sp. T786]|uniref:hypothetical protein n=1 Tax=Pseudorhizobium xiangyangii TaxID=2883104 RepID=UPI001D001209|nr:hypothetical protein [Neorhizobium xiangyangii]MCB5205489.1 hypothetical protein [Neorhizobium xiangyangii]
MFDPLQHALAIVSRETGELIAFAESTHWLAEEGFREVVPDIPESETITAIYYCYVITRMDCKPPSLAVISV